MYINRIYIKQIGFFTLINVSIFGNFYIFTKMKNNKLNFSSLTEMKDKYIGKIGTVDRDKYEKEVRKNVLKKILPISINKLS